MLLPTLTLFFFHWNVANPPLTGVATKLTVAPLQKGFGEAEIDTPTALVAVLFIAISSVEAAQGLLVIVHRKTLVPTSNPTTLLLGFEGC